MLKIKRVFHYQCCLCTLTITYIHSVSFIFCYWTSIGSIMVSVLALSVVDRWFEPRSGPTKDYKIGICICLSAKHSTLWSKSTGRLARKQDNVSVWSDMCTRELLFPWPTIQITTKHVDLVHSGHHQHLN